MDLLETAMADVALLMATARALRMGAVPGSGAVAGADGLRGRRRMPGELRRAAVAYVKSLLRTEGTLTDAEWLATCRVAAERRMPASLAARSALRSVMTTQPGALDGFAVARHDLWRLGHLAVALQGLESPQLAKDRDSGSMGKSARRFGKRLRKAMVAYVRAGVRSEGNSTAAVAAARRATLEELDSAGRRDFRGEDGDGTIRLFRADGIERGLRDLAADWRTPNARARPQESP